MTPLEARASHPQARSLDVLPVFVVRGEGGPQKDLTAGPSQHLIVGGDGHGLPQGVHPVLGGGRTLVRSLHKKLDHPLHLLEFPMVALPMLPRRLKP